MKGFISTERTVWCGLCEHWEQYTSENFFSVIRQKGWRITHKYGWLCKECRKKIKNESV